MKRDPHVAPSTTARAEDGEVEMIIVLQGKPGAGKTTAANYLMRERGFVLHKIATPLKNMLRVGFGLTDAHIEGHLKREPCAALGGRTPVHAMRTLGGEWRDLMHPDLWLMAWEATRPDAPRIVVDDNRYPQEVAYFRSLGEQVVFVRLERPSGEGDDGSKHMAENQVLDFDVQVGNSGTVQDLERMLGALVDQLVKVPCP